jgi:diguanylate cyclase (GGDEF)-like protein/PAS domain S-box-containing protein
MKLRDSKADEEVRILYELSLAIGRSHDPLESSMEFLDALIARKALSSVCLWVRGDRLEFGGDAARLRLFAAQAVGGRTGPAEDSFECERLELLSGPRVLRSAHQDYGSWTQTLGGAPAWVTVWPLADFAALTFCGRSEEDLAPHEVDRLRSVVERFSVTLHGQLAARLLVAEAARRKAAQESLEREQALLRSLIDSIPDLIYYQDLDGAYLGCNKAFEAFVGRSEGALVGLGAAEGPDLPLSNLAGEATQTERREVSWTERPDGRRVLLDTVLTPYYGPDDRRLGVIGISRDVTEQQRANEALRQSEERFRELAEQARVLPWEFEWQSRRFTYVGPQARDLLGFAQEDWLRPGFWEEHIHTNDREWVIQYCENQLRIEAQFELDYRMFTADGRTVWVRDIVTVTSSDDHPPLLRGYLIDVTKRKSAELAACEGEQQLATLLRLSRKLNSRLDREVVAHVLVEAGQQLTDALSGSFGVIEAGRICFAVANQGGDWVAKPACEPLYKKLALQARAHDGLYVSNDTALDPQLRDDATPKPMPFRQVIAIEVCANDGTSLGCLILHDLPDGRAFNGRDKKLLRGLAYSASIALHNSRLLDDARDARQRLQESEERYRAIVEQAVDAVVLYRTADGAFVEFNEPAHRSLGYGREEFARLTIGDIEELGAREPCASSEEQTPAADAEVFETRHRTRSGERRDMLVAARRLELRGEQYIAAVWHDITDRRRDEARLRQSAKVFESTAEGVFITDAANQIVAVNKTFTEITGYAEADVLGRDPSLLASGRQDRHFYGAMWRELRTTGKWQGEIWNRRKNGEVYPQWATISEVRDEKGRLTHHVSVFSDISVIKRSLEQLDHLAHHDPLTDLPNRLLFLSRLEFAINRNRRDGQRLAVLFLDLDRFKNINDSLGHPVGDQLLQAVSRRLLGRLRAEDTLARLGGDEFTVLLEQVSKPQDAAEVARTLIESLRAPIKLPDNHEVYVDVSIGVAISPDDGLDATALVRNADAAMYRAKESGPGSFRFYTEDMTREIADRLAMETRLRQAFERGVLQLDYQPVFALADRRLLAVEALVHWIDPELGAVSPERFIPLAEETGLIEPMGEWVLEEACLQVARWSEVGLPPLNLAVNLSVRQLERPGFAERVKAVLARSGLPAQRLELELTETSLMSQPRLGQATLDELKACGIRLAVDDFGTGYSSLAYLKRLAVDKLKIDKSFVSDMPQDKSDLQIVSAITVMARNLGLTIVAEGVETIEQEKILNELGCDCAQGFLYARPLAAKKMERFLRQHATGAAEAKAPVRRKTVA